LIADEYNLQQPPINEDMYMSDAPQPPTSTEDRVGWNAYWSARGMPWRMEPEIDEGRQRYLDKRRAISPDIERGIYPFRDENGPIKLSRGDVEWLLARHESCGVRGPVNWLDPSQWNRGGLDLRGADVTDVDLHGLPLARLRGGLAGGEYYLAATSGQQHPAALVALRAKLYSAHLEGSVLNSAYLKEADLYDAHLEGADLYGAQLEGADLRNVYFDSSSTLNHVALANVEGIGPLLRDVRWGGVNLSGVSWAQVRMLGEEKEAEQSTTSDVGHKDPATRSTEYERAVRSNRQLAAALRSQGLNEDADHFAYRAQLCQRLVLRFQRHYLRYLGSLFLGLVAGYGYRPLRSLVTYLTMILFFAGIYLTMGGTGGHHALTWNEALVVSLTAFHGRGFFATAFQPGDPQAAVAAIEAVFGLLIEITFIATFTQRFFAR
jgi:hypothetical protein